MSRVVVTCWSYFSVEISNFSGPSMLTYVAAVTQSVNPLMARLKPPSNGQYSNTETGTLSVDGWAVTFGTARRGLGGLRPRPVPSSMYQT